MRVVITGGTGFLGRPLVAHLAGLGYECTVLTRDPARVAQSHFPSGVKIASLEPLPACDVLIHLAGESLAGLWTERKKRAIFQSRIAGTRRLVAAVRHARVRPHTLLAASAVGYYGDRPGELLAETAPADPGGSFRSQVCTAWEAAAHEADTLGLRVVHLRLGNVLAPSGGLLLSLLPVYRSLGGLVLGDPDAALPWISLPDATRLIAFALAHERWFGAVNLTAPKPVSHRQFTATLADRLHRPAFWRVPAALLRLTLGELSAALLDDQNVRPAKALAAHFTYTHPTWESWLDSTFPQPAPAPCAEPLALRD